MPLFLSNTQHTELRINNMYQTIYERLRYLLCRSGHWKRRSMEVGLGLSMSLSPGIALSSRVFCDETRKKKGKCFSFRRQDLYISSATTIEHYTWIERMELVNPRKLTCLLSGWRKSLTSRPDLDLQPRRGKDRDSRRGEQ
jgi:hypothetical protein